jgi:hypothetical protein
LAQQALAHQEGARAGGGQAGDVGVRADAAFGDEEAVGGEVCGECFGCSKISP